MNDQQAVRSMILGALTGALADVEFPVKVGTLRPIPDQHGTIQSVIVTTESGLRYRVEVVPL